jgi:hypothetical protein
VSVSIILVFTPSSHLLSGTWADWSSTFSVPVYMAAADQGWASRRSHNTADLHLLHQTTEPIFPGSGLTAITCGGHFPGSLCLHWSGPNLLFCADTLLAVKSAWNPDPGKPGVVSYSFLWSIPNNIPLPPDAIWGIWKALKPFEFRATFGVFAKSSNVVEREGQRLSLKARVLESMKIQVRAMGYAEHGLLDELL